MMNPTPHRGTSALYSAVESDRPASNGASFEPSTDPCYTTLTHEEAMPTTIVMPVYQSRYRLIR